MASCNTEQLFNVRQQYTDIKVEYAKKRFMKLTGTSTLNGGMRIDPGLIWKLREIYLCDLPHQREIYKVIARSCFFVFHSLASYRQSWICEPMDDRYS
jgi:hypothetical protein